jgi:hypothetical protein
MPTPKNEEEKRMRQQGINQSEFLMNEKKDNPPSSQRRLLEWTRDSSYSCWDDGEASRGIMIGSFLFCQNFETKI